MEFTPERLAALEEFRKKREQERIKKEEEHKHRISKDILNAYQDELALNCFVDYLYKLECRLNSLEELVHEHLWAE